MNCAVMILPASSDNSPAKIYLLFVKNSVLSSMLLIREDVVSKILLLLSISVPSQIRHWQGIQIDFMTFGTELEFMKVVLSKLEHLQTLFFH